MAVLTTNSLTKYYGAVIGIKELNLNVPAGSIFGLIGPNGAGKTTLMRLLMNFIFPTNGEAQLFGLDIVKDSYKIKELVGYLPSEVHYYPEQTVKSLLNYTMRFTSQIQPTELSELVNYFELNLNRKFSELSFGNKKKLALVVALIKKPKLLILDEPTTGLDPLIQQKLLHWLKNYQAAGNTVFLSSHNLAEVASLCDEVAIIRQGKIVEQLDLNQARLGLGKIITLKGEIPASILKKYASLIIVKSPQEISWRHQGPLGPLLKDLSNCQLTDISITDADLAELFFEYYQSEEKTHESSSL